MRLPVVGLLEHVQCRVWLTDIPARDGSYQNWKVFHLTGRHTKEIRRRYSLFLPVSEGQGEWPFPQCPTVVNPPIVSRET